jgi:hypothetical protein
VSTRTLVTILYCAGSLCFLIGTLVNHFARGK